MNKRSQSEKHKLTHLEELHSKVNAVSITARDSEIPRPCGAGSKYDCVILGPDIINVDVHANMRVGDENLQYKGWEDVTASVPEVLTTPSAAMRSSRRCTIALSSFILY